MGLREEGLLWACGKSREPGAAATLSQQVRALAEYTRALLQGVDFLRALSGAPVSKTSSPCAKVPPYPPGLKSQPIEFKAWNFSLRFLTLPCWLGSTGSLGPSSFS